MLTMLDNTTRSGKGKISDSIEINNTYFDSRVVDNKVEVNEEAIGIALTSVFKFEKLFKLINKLTTSLVKVKYSSLMLIEGDTLRIKYSNHLTEDIEQECRVKVGDGISGWVALKGVNVIVKNIETDTRFAKRNNARYSSKSFMSVPLIISGKVIGVLNVNEKSDGRAFNERDLGLLRILSRYSAIAIRNATLIGKTKGLSIVQQLDNDYYNKTEKFLPVTLKSLKIGPFNKSELYLKNSLNGENNYVLYWKGGDRLFINEKREEFIRKNINKLFVPKNGRKQYLRFMETNMEKIVQNDSACSKEKFDVIQNVAVNIISDLTAIPEEVCNIERAKQWIESAMGLVRSSGKDYIGLSNTKGYDIYLYGHSINVTLMSLVFAHHIGLNIEETGEFALGLLLQDIGMRSVDSLIINKPSKLNSDEYNIIKKHSEIGFQMLQETGQVSPESYMLALLHHENFNGSGYPHGLKENEISLYGRISRIIDVYCAITSDRPYAKACTSDDACMIMKAKMKGFFDTEVLDNFIDLLKSGKGVAKTRLVSS
ncbi:HD domain-containing phosphohydrolase [Candidatus Scalindua japonica]|nr:HD domain-containing phosphohydrolase [Candidatus Scalindua japonica]